MTSLQKEDHSDGHHLHYLSKNSTRKDRIAGELIALVPENSSTVTKCGNIGEEQAFYFQTCQMEKLRFDTMQLK